MGDGSTYRPSRITLVIEEVLGRAKSNLQRGSEIRLDPYVIAGQYGLCLPNGFVVVRTVIAKLEAGMPGLAVDHQRGQPYVISCQGGPGPVIKPAKPTTPKPAGGKTPLFKCQSCNAVFETESALGWHQETCKGARS